MNWLSAVASGSVCWPSESCQNAPWSGVGAQVKVHRPYTINEKIAHAVSHGVAAVASIVGLAVLVAYASLYGSMLHVVAVSIFGGSLILLYTASTLYHSIPIPAAEPVLHTLDHAAIYVLIAGTYTPFALVCLEGAVRWWLFGLVWSMALAGVIFKLFFTGRFDKLSVGLYLAMGWLVVAFAKPVLEAVPLAGLAWLAAGGVSYTVGAAFYLWRSLPYNHTIWHVFVVLGSVLQYLAVLWYVVPGPPAA
ncbi:MAG: hemolysin III family protein [Oceanococcus sp.]|nr:MAG: hemolysin III family protein [Oceanococcus sp.]